MEQTYVDCLAKLGVGGAHPGGLRLSKQLLAQEKLKAGMSVLDAGCGTGQTAAFLATNYPCSIFAIDVNERMVKKCRKRCDEEGLTTAAVKQENVEKLSFADDSFDLILAESVIAFTDVRKTVAEFKRVLKPHGRLLAIEISKSGPLQKDEEEMICDFYGFTKLQTANDWKTSFLDGGFSDVDVTARNIAFTRPEPEDAPDFQLDDEIDQVCFDVMGEHEYLTKSYRNELSFHIFHCT